MERLDGAQSAAAVRLRALKTAKGREAQGLILVEGEKMILEALSSGLVPREAIFDAARADLINALAGRLAGARCYVAPERILTGVCDTVTPQGVCASFPIPAPMGAYPDRLIALDGVQDPGNAGTIWRTADAAGYQGLLFGENCADPLSPKTQRASMGSSFRLPAKRVTLVDTLRDLQKAGAVVAAASLSGSDASDYPGAKGKIVLIVGSEAHGVRDEILGLCDLNLKIPMRGGAESLNAAVAAGILMYRIWRG